MQGRIIALCTSPRGGVPKYPQKSVVVGDFGLVGDYHNKPTRESFSKPGTQKANDDRHITIVGWEAVAAVTKKLGITLGAGALGENFLTGGLGNLSNVIPHTRITVGGILTGQLAEFRVVEQNQPCKNLVPYHPQFNKEIHDRRGLLCVVVSGIGNTIHVNEWICLEPPLCTECGYKMSQKGTCWLCFNCRQTLGCEPAK